MTTLVVATHIRRKNTDVAIAAWKKAFEGDPDARLMIKSRYSYGNYTPDDPRIRLVDQNEMTRGIARWYREADVLLALGNEGFGLPLVEGMATGLPVVALDAEGQSDVCADAREFVLSVPPRRTEPFSSGVHGAAGMRSIPDADEVAERLRWVNDHRDEARAMGRAASEWAVRHRSVWSKGPAVLDAIERHLGGGLAVRRADTFWVPSWGAACGLSEYTRHLAEHLPGARVSADRPDPRGCRVVHVQHQDSLSRDHELAAALREYRTAGVPVVVTVHSVGHHPYAWEREADVLVSLTRRGAEILRARWPGKRVESFPHGCPTWFPPRKEIPGRVIGAFGFMEEYKGFRRLPGVLRDLPDAELLLFSHAKGPAALARWENEARGLNVRRVGEYLPVEEVARRLAAEADVLAFLYDDVPHPSASGAVRVALATGVPVLTSHANWFEELGGAVHRCDSADASEGVRRLLEDGALRRSVVESARSFCLENSWSVSAARHAALWRSLTNG